MLWLVAIKIRVEQVKQKRLQNKTCVCNKSSKRRRRKKTATKNDKKSIKTEKKHSFFQGTEHIFVRCCTIIKFNNNKQANKNRNSLTSYPKSSQTNRKKAEEREFETA